jgi:hypothetical protein
MKNSNYTIGNWSRDLLVCSAVPQPLRHRVPHSQLIIFKFTTNTILCNLVIWNVRNSFHDQLYYKWWTLCAVSISQSSEQQTKKRRPPPGPKSTSLSRLNHSGAWSTQLKCEYTYLTNVNEEWAYVNGFGRVFCRQLGNGCKALPLVKSMLWKKYERILD